MNGEQRYNEALERARKEYKNHEGFKGFRGKLERIFPELKESEGERIRREIITYLSTVEDKEFIPYESWIAWLEKQRPVEEIVERYKTSWFHAGKIQGKMEGLSDEEKYQQGWHDALEKQSEQKSLEEGTFVNVDEVREDFMQEVYRVLDADPTNDRANQIIDAFDNLPTISIQKPAKNIVEWNEVDENEYNHILKILNLVAEEQEIKGYNNLISSVNWLKSLKDRIQSKQSNKPQDKTALEAIKEEKVDNANKVEPKFKIGDWVTVGRHTILICEIHYDLYDIMFASGEHRVYDTNILDEDKEAHLWTIADAKDGDVLISCMNKPFIYNGFFDESAVGSYCGLNIDGQFYVYGLYERKPIWGDNEGIKPATKEQRNMLFSKMKEAGYEWDAEKKDLTKLPNSFCQENCKGFQEIGKCYADGDCKAKIEAESAEKTKPKFKVGDWVVRKDGGVFFEDIKFAQITEIDGEKHWFDTGLIYLKAEDMKLWTLEDAKDGDILYSKKHNLLWRYKNTKECYFCINLNYNSNNISIGDVMVIPNDVRPATREQRHLVFDKMLQHITSKNNGKKELKEIETKFHVFHEGDWIVVRGEVILICDIRNNLYDVIFADGEHRLYDTNILDKEAHLWTIADAKDGDVLVASDGSIFIFAGVVDYACKYYVALTLYNGLSINKEVELGSWELANHVHPATKEQCDLLFAKMREKRI